MTARQASATEAHGLLRPPPLMKVRLTKKLAECIDGVALHDYSVGDVLDLPQTEARLLLAEEWAVRHRNAPAALSGPRNRRAAAAHDRDRPAKRR
jgi:hypothetical protein